MEGSQRKENERREPSRGIPAYGSEQSNPSGRILEEGYERKGSDWKNPSGGIHADGSVRMNPSGWI